MAKAAGGSKQAAIAEYQRKSTEHADFLAGVKPCSPWVESVNTVAALVEAYLTKRKEDRSQEFLDRETASLGRMVEKFGERNPATIRLSDLDDYMHWRLKQIDGSRGPGYRTIEMEWTALSNALNYAVERGWLDFNYIARRKRLCVEDPKGLNQSRIQHCREFAPFSSDQVHAVADELFKDARSQASGWCWLFGCLTGLRLNELLALRMDATPKQAGFFADGALWFDRPKGGGRCQFQELTDAALDMVACHANWHDGTNPFYFPGANGNPLDDTTPGYALRRVCARLGLPQYRMHGARSFYATSLRIQGKLDWEVAEALGDRTVGLIDKVYGQRPQRGEFSYMPSTGLPSWERFRSVERKIIAL